MPQPGPFDTAWTRGLLLLLLLDPLGDHAPALLRSCGRDARRGPDSFFPPARPRPADWPPPRSTEGGDGSSRSRGPASSGQLAGGAASAPSTGRGPNDDPRISTLQPGCLATGDAHKIDAAEWGRAAGRARRNELTSCPRGNRPVRSEAPRRRDGDWRGTAAGFRAPARVTRSGPRPSRAGWPIDAWSRARRSTGSARHTMSYTPYR